MGIVCPFSVALGAGRLCALPCSLFLLHFICCFSRGPPHDPICETSPLLPLDPPLYLQAVGWWLLLGAQLHQPSPTWVSGFAHSFYNIGSDLDAGLPVCGWGHHRHRQALHVTTACGPSTPSRTHWCSVHPSPNTLNPTPLPLPPPPCSFCFNFETAPPYAISLLHHPAISPLPNTAKGKP